MSPTSMCHLLLPCIIATLFVADSFAENPAITVKGATAKLDFKSVIARFTLPLSHDDLRRLAMEITNIYHEYGYTTSFAEKVIVKKNGDVEILVRESRIVDVSVLGIPEESAKKVIAILSPTRDELYNTITIKDRAEQAAKRLKLSTVKIDVQNADNSADVILKVTARESRFGATRMKMYYEPIYGLTPLLAYDQTIGKISFSFSGSLSVRNSEYRKKCAAAMITYFSGKPLSFYAQYDWTTSIETWKEKLNDFHAVSNRPGLGMQYAIHRNIICALSSVFNFFVLDNYRDSQNSYHDVSLSLSGHYTNAPDIIVPGDDTKARIEFSITRSDLEKKHFITTGLFFHTLFSPTAWLNIRPSLAGDFTSADERYYRWYIYDETFPVKSDDYAATHARISGRLYFEFETYPEMLYLGPIGYHTFFYNETSFEMQSSSAIGIATKILLGRFYIHAMCIFPVEKVFAHPVVLFSASGVF